MSSAKKLSPKAMAAIIARRKAAGTKAPSTRRRTTKAAAPTQPLVRPRSYNGTLSDITEIKTPKGSFYRAQFQMRTGTDFTSVTALISDKTATAMGGAFKDGFIKLYGALQNDSLRVFGLGRDRMITMPEMPALEQGPAADYGYQFGAYFPT
jgi:hypothetical protein